MLKTQIYVLYIIISYLVTDGILLKDFNGRETLLGPLAVKNMFSKFPNFIFHLTLIFNSGYVGLFLTWQNNVLHFHGVWLYL